MQDMLEENFRVTRRLSNREKKLLRKKNNNSQQNKTPQEKLNFTLKNIEPLTDTQREVFYHYEDNKNLMLHGYPGTGKSFLSLYLALNEVLSSESGYKKIIIVRSTVSVRDIGFLPGKPADKIEVYEQPYVEIFKKLFGRGDAYSYMKSKGIVEFISTSFIRGITLDNCIVIVDEIANCTFHELDSVITRVGKNCKIVFAGDYRQTDFDRDKDKSGLKDFMKIVKSMKQFEFIEFNEQDIVRSGLVKSYIIAKMNYEQKGYS